jgi:hypothetical protein
MKQSITDFFTRPLANKGIKLKLRGPDGKETEAELTVLGTDSDAFRKARVVRSRDSAEILTLPEEEQPAATVEADVRLLASLVTSWSFKEACNKENVVKLLLEAPHVRDQIDATAANRALFLSPKS